ncbi:hypothetical protein D9M70_600760 [compost metagenome]
MPADQVWAGVAVGLGVNEQHGFADLGGHGVLAGQGTDLAVEHDMARDQRAHGFAAVGVAGGQVREVLVVALFILWNVQVEFADAVGAVIA